MFDRIRHNNRYDLFAEGGIQVKFDVAALGELLIDSQKMAFADGRIPSEKLYVKPEGRTACYVVNAKLNGIVLYGLSGSKK